MMDGQVGAIRRGLDSAGFDHAASFSYSVKYASSMYGPFREAGEGAPQFGDRRGYQMDYRRSREWKREIGTRPRRGGRRRDGEARRHVPRRDLRRAKCLRRSGRRLPRQRRIQHDPRRAERNWIDLKGAAVETTTAIKRAGADLILTYFAPKLIEWL